MVRRRAGEKFEIVLRVGARGRDVDCVALVDSGAEVNIVSLALVQKYGWPVRKTGLGEPRFLIGFAGEDGGEVEVVGAVRVGFVVGGYSFVGCFYVMNIYRDPPILLSSEFLDQNRLSMIWSKKECYLK